MGVGGHAGAKTGRGGEGVEEVREGVEVGVDGVEAHSAVEFEGGGVAGRRSEEGVPGEGRRSWVGEVEGWVDVGDEPRRSLHGELAWDGVDVIIFILVFLYYKFD